MMRAAALEKGFLKDAMLPEVSHGQSVWPGRRCRGHADGASWRFRDESFKQHSLDVIQQADFSHSTSDRGRMSYVCVCVGAYIHQTFGGQIRAVRPDRRADTATNSAINSRLSIDPPPPPFAGGLTVTVTDCEAWPPSPVQVRVYVVEVVSTGVVNASCTLLRAAPAARSGTGRCVLDIPAQRARLTGIDGGRIGGEGNHRSRLGGCGSQQVGTGFIRSCRAREHVDEVIARLSRETELAEGVDGADEIAALGHRDHKALERRGECQIGRDDVVTSGDRDGQLLTARSCAHRLSDVIDEAMCCHSLSH